MKKSIFCMAAAVLLSGGLWAQTQPVWLTSGNTSISHFILGSTDKSPLHIRTNNTIRMSIDTIGNVGIGTDNPQAKLAVNGEILAKSVRVNTSNTYWPDYVFGNDYNLMSLRELEQYVNTYKHLPNIPSAQEIETQGDVDLGAMNALLLEKVEELTRYVIDLQKQIDELKKGKE